MLAAALDLGSNTLRLLVAEVRGGDWRALHRDLAAPRLGQGLQAGAPLHPEAKRRARDAAAAFAAKARELGAERVALAATQACRLAGDGADFVAGLGRELGLNRARVLSGVQEAALSRRGVISRLTGPLAGALLADVGGGSSELTPLDREQAGLSLPLGAVSLTEAHIASDPPAPAELEALEAAVAAGLAPLAGRRPARLVASAGTAASLAALRLGMSRYRPEAIDNLAVGRRELKAELTVLAALPLAQRRRALAFDPARADIIVAGLAILDGMLAVLGLEELTAMDSGLLEGILLDEASQWQRGE